MDYRERVTATPLFRWLLRLLVVIPVLIGLAAVLVDDDEAFVGGITLVVVLIVLVCVERWFMVLDVRVQRGEVQAAFGPFRKRLTPAQIASVGMEPYAWTQYGGWGIRWGFQKRRAWTVPFLRTGIVLALVDGTRYFISSRQPDRLLAAVQTILDEADPNTAGGVSG